ncbi:MAG: DUF423 domain-containing protein [Gammaproteobacteria bacterium]|nr:MAG: DUF423 domain-containing protein [Gammaproteobacteria bacterium]
MESRLFLLLGAIGGFFAVAFGAFGAHALREILSPGLLEVFRTGVHYQATHSLALLAVGLLIRDEDCLSYRVAGWGFSLGILLFSGSLYVMAIVDAPWLGAITPFGGAAFLVGWSALAWGLFRLR